MNVTVDPEALPYLIAVRARLAGMSADYLNEIVADLEQHLAEMISEGDEPLVERLGSPDQYAEELAQSAGWMNLEPLQLSLLQRISTRWTNLALSAPGRWWARTWNELRPGWWVARGLIVPAVWAGLDGRDVFFGFGWIWFIPAVALSVAVGRRSGLGTPWRLGDSLATFIALWALIAGGLNGIGIYDRDIPNRYLDMNPRGVVGLNGPIYDFHAYDLDGQPVTVFLYDQNGQEVLTEQSQGSVRSTVDGQPVKNLYPLEAERSGSIKSVPELGPECATTGERLVVNETCLYPPR
ncbi:MAG: HAAS signaling domain-containing protein [Acidimicrobiia bacterium]